MYQHRAFAFTDMIVVLVLGVAILGCIASTPGCGDGGGASNANKKEASARLREIHRALSTHSQSNQGYYAGLTSGGELAPGGGDPAMRYSVLLKAKLLEPRALVNPIETSRTQATGDSATKANFSFALLRIDEANGRRREWKDSQDSQAVIASDRNIGSQGPAARSIAGGDRWQGAVLWADGHSLWEMSNVLRSSNSYFADGSSDDLFGNDIGVSARYPSEPGNDAAMVFQDAISYTNQN